MPTIKQNMAKWDGTYHWRGGGDNWSKPWGGPEMQWRASILPRIHSFVPAGVILEIGPGFGRWTVFLKDLCDELIIVDLSGRCIQACKQRFGEEAGIRYHVNDGRSLEMVPDDSIDFVFSYDSLVHAEKDVIRAYLEQLPAKLKPNGVGFIHHSNAGQYDTYFKWVRGIPPLKLLFRLLRQETKVHGRARSVSAAEFREIATSVGLQCIGQEIINWRSKMLLDCQSVITKPGSIWSREFVTVRNPDFMAEAKHICRIASLYREPTPASTDASRSG